MGLLVNLVLSLTLCLTFSNTQLIVNGPNVDRPVEASRSFTIDPVAKTFLKDGVPFRYVSGTFHYFQTIRDSWKDIMTKMTGAGINVLQTYTEWSQHEPEPGVYNFEGESDIVAFLKMAQEVGLLVVFRPGPYICAERDMGGFPYWLMREKPDIQLRTMDQYYIERVDKYFDVLFQKIEPLLYKNGGPIILVQVENEYGQFDKCDKTYMTHLRNKTWEHFGQDVILFRTNSAYESAFKCDFVEGVMATGDLMASQSVASALKVLRKANPNQPIVFGEFYPGWIDHWGMKHDTRGVSTFISRLDEILAANCSVNIYPIHGGTNFGFSNGANPPYQPQITSYDFSAPISEAGDLTDVYFKTRDVIGKYLPLPPKPSPTPSAKLTLGPLELSKTSSLLSALPFLDGPQPVHSKYPLTFEALSADRGFVAYSTNVSYQPTDPVLLSAEGVRDRGYVFVNYDLRGILSRTEKLFQIPLTVIKGDTITIVVENQGRINYGEENRDMKGLLSNVTLSKKVLDQWIMTPIPLNNTQAIHQLGNQINVRSRSAVESSFKQGFYTVHFSLPNGTLAADSFLDPTGWYRGVAFFNGFNLGRYWPIAGPQVTLYVPKQLFKEYPNINVLTVLELEGIQDASTMKFVDTPILDGPVSA